MLTHANLVALTGRRAVENFHLIFTVKLQQEDFMFLENGFSFLKKKMLLTVFRAGYFLQHQLSIETFPGALAFKIFYTWAKPLQGTKAAEATSRAVLK